MRAAAQIAPRFRADPLDLYDTYPLALPAAWTDVVAPDPFVLAAHGRSLFRTQDLWELVRMLRRGRS